MHAASLLLAVIIMASHRDLSCDQGYILFLSMTFRIGLEILEMSICMLMTLPYPLLVKVYMKFLLHLMLLWTMCYSGAKIIN